MLLVAVTVVVQDGTASNKPQRLIASSSPIDRIWLDGRRLNLSGARVADEVRPALSPDGRWVAFAKHPDGDPNGKVVVEVVGTDGRGLRPVSQVFPGGNHLFQIGALVWSPDNKRLALLANDENGRTTSVLYVLQPGRPQRLIAHKVWGLVGPNYYGTFQAPLGWSPDGRVITFSVDPYNAAAMVRAITPEGRSALSLRGRTASWSRNGTLALGREGRKVRLYDAQGRLLAGFPGRTFAWSPSGERLATVTGNRVVVRDGGGRGHIVLSRVIRDRPPAPGQPVEEILWAGETKLVINSPDLGSALVVQSDRNVPRSYIDAGAVSPDGSKIAVIDSASRERATLTVSRLDGKASRTLVSRACVNTLLRGDVRWLPDGTSLVYHFGCGIHSG